MTRRLLCLLCAMLMAAGLVSCSSSSDPVSVPADPTVESMSPSDGATNVGLVERVEIEFSEALDPATVSDTTLTVTARGVTGFVEYDEATHTVSFTPDTLYAASSWFDVFVSGAVEDLDGNAVGQNEVSSFQTGDFECANLTDHMEPNNSIAEAVPIETGRTYRSLTGCDSDTDFFEFTLDDTLKVLPLAEFKRANEWCYLYVRRHTGEDYGFMGGNVDDGSFVGGMYTLMPGTYYAELTTPDGYEEWVLYDFSVSTTDPCNDDAYEDNDFFDEATPVINGLHQGLRGCRVDRDYFSFPANAGQTITLTFDVDEVSTHTRQYGIYGPAYQQMELYWDTGDPVTISAVAGQTGTYYAYARHWMDGCTYDMTVNVEW